MKKLVLIFVTLGLMFQITGCNGKKAQDDTEIVENADVEKIEAEDAHFSGDSNAQTGPIDESLQAALGETPQIDGASVDNSTTASTDVINTQNNGTDIAATPAPSIDENSLTAPTDVATNATPIDAGITETPVIDSSTTDTSVAQTDPSLVPDTTITGGVSEATGVPPEITETPITETPVAETSVPSELSTPSESALAAQASVEYTPAAPAPSSGLKKIAETVPYKYGDGFVNTVYIARPKEKLADISNAIYGMDKTKELKSINKFLKSSKPKAGDKIYYVSPNRPTDSTRTISYYEDTGMIASSYVVQKGDDLKKVAKKLLGYDNAWKEVWTTNAVESKTKLVAGETLQYWKPAETTSTPTLAQNDGNAKLIDSTQQMPQQVGSGQNVAVNTPPPPPQEMTPPPPQEVAQNTAQELPPPPPPQEVAQNTAQELPPPQEMIPPPPPQEVAAVPVPPKQKPAHNMEEEPAAEEGAGMSSDTTMMMGVLAVLVAILAMVLVRRNKKKKEAEMASIEQTHVGT